MTPILRSSQLKILLKEDSRYRLQSLTKCPLGMVGMYIKSKLLKNASILKLKKELKLNFGSLNQSLWRETRTQHSSLLMVVQDSCFPLKKIFLSAIDMQLIGTASFSQLTTEKVLRQSAQISKKTLQRLSSMSIKIQKNMASKNLRSRLEELVSDAGLFLVECTSYGN